MPRVYLQPYSEFKLDNLSFGWDLTPFARASLDNIHEATRELKIEKSAVVTACLAALAYVCKNYYPHCATSDRSPFGRGISAVWTELEKKVPIPEGHLQLGTQREALKIFVRPSPFRPSQEETLQKYFTNSVCQQVKSTEPEGLLSILVCL